MIINRNYYWMMLVGLVAMTIFGCAKKAQQIDYSKAECPASEFYLTDVQITNITMMASTNSAAAFRLYLYYGGFRSDTKQSMYWLKKAAEEGDARSQYNLGVSLLSVPGYLDSDQSKEWLKKSAAQGYEPATQLLFEPHTPTNAK